MSKTGTLYLIPSFLGNEDPSLLSAHNVAIIHRLDEFIVENEKPARAFLKAVESPIGQPNFTFHLMGKHSDVKDYPAYLDACLKGKDIGLLSDAGLPCVADPGFELVKLAHQKNIKVVPLMGLSSIMMALMASGFNGQSFRFHGYLPHDQNQRRKIIKQILSDLSRNETQIFIETPYRNAQIINELKTACPPQTKLCVAVDLSLESEYVATKPLGKWSSNESQFHKRPAVFLLGL